MLILLEFVLLIRLMLPTSLLFRSLVLLIRLLPVLLLLLLPVLLLLLLLPVFSRSPPFRGLAAMKLPSRGGSAAK